MLISQKNIPYYLAAVSLFIVFKLLFRLSSTDSLLFLLMPSNYLFELLSGSSALYQVGEGYYHQNLNIIIDKSCSGFNFWLLCFMMLSFLSLKYLEKGLSKFLSIPISLVVAYFITIFANSSRIFSALMLEDRLTDFLDAPSSIIHEAIGIITYLSFLILAYWLVDRFFIKRQSDAQLT